MRIRMPAPITTIAVPETIAAAATRTVGGSWGSRVRRRSRRPGRATSARTVRQRPDESPSAPWTTYPKGEIVAPTGFPQQERIRNGQTSRGIDYLDRLGGLRLDHAHHHRCDQLLRGPDRCDPRPVLRDSR